jgi:hypothetical protein
MFIEPLQEIFSRQDAKGAKKKYFLVSELGVLCVPSTLLLRTCFAGVISFPILQANMQPRISKLFG